MDNLQLEMYLEIFKYLNLNDLLNCQLVSKRFKFICNQLKIKKLNVDGSFKIEKYQYPFECSIDALKRSKSFNLEKNLKYLDINCSTDFHFELINKFREIIELRISNVYKEGIYTIELPKLKSIIIDYLNDDSKLILRTEKLESIETGSIFNNEVIYNLNNVEVELGYLNVKKIKSCYYDNSFGKFKNLEILELEDLRDLDRNILKIFPNLKKLNYFNCSVKYDRKLISINNSIENILNEQNELNRLDFKFYLDDIQIQNNGNFNYSLYLDDKFRFYQENGYSRRNDLRFQIQNLDQLNDDNLIMYTKFNNYNDLIELPSDKQLIFLNKFTNIQSVEISNEVTNQDHLLWFLSKLNKLNKLKLINTKLNQQFLDKLPL